mmetsp:Transcript_43/g.73  ORF Transcript_43/g.73 Transcript_43/m.73 type:complete len:81 (+) Transcript_43:115-357(+)
MDSLNVTLEIYRNWFNLAIQSHLIQLIHYINNSINTHNDLHIHKTLKRTQHPFARIIFIVEFLTQQLQVARINLLLVLES